MDYAALKNADKAIPARRTYILGANEKFTGARKRF